MNLFLEVIKMDLVKIREEKSFQREPKYFVDKVHS